VSLGVSETTKWTMCTVVMPWCICIMGYLELDIEATLVTKRLKTDEL
jgi:hypothetical protein